MFAKRKLPIGFPGLWQCWRRRGDKKAEHARILALRRPMWNCHSGKRFRSDNPTRTYFRIFLFTSTLAYILRHISFVVELSSKLMVNVSYRQALLYHVTESIIWLSKWTLFWTETFSVLLHYFWLMNGQNFCSIHSQMTNYCRGHSSKTLNH
jgi:hypothetical protein